MDTNDLLRKNGISPEFVDDFSALCRFAAQLAKEGVEAGDIIRHVRENFAVQIPLSMRAQKEHYAIYGEPGVDFELGAIEQMDMAARLPVFAAGAVLPDAHPGYALPIGGVAQLDNAVSPYMVGVDIACRMSMTIFEDLLPEQLRAHKEAMHASLVQVTRFGLDTFEQKRDHPVMDDALWNDRSLPVRSFKDRAHQQLGTSGGGNHFADLMVGEVLLDVDWLPLKPGDQFTCLLTHSGSRGVGHKMAMHYSKLAEKQTQRVARNIPRQYCWLDMDTDAGREYWDVMQLMGRYAQANHHLVHAHFMAECGLNALALSGQTKVETGSHEAFNLIENHHNFCWEENGKYTHRKGATPAAVGQPGLIPGSSGTASFLVQGRGNADSLQSCSHGAGRPFSRTRAKQVFDARRFNEHMSTNAILHDGVAPDESFMAYKDINRVIELQEGELIDVVARMYPVVVRMGGASDDGD